MDLVGYGHAFAALAYTGLALWLIRRPWPSRVAPAWLVLAAVVGTAAWAGFSAAQSVVGEAVPPALLFALDLLRYALWLACLLAMLRRAGPLARENRWLPAVAGGLLVANAALPLLVPVGIVPGTALLQASLFCALALPVLGASLVEQVYRNLPEDLRWTWKPFCLALAIPFVFDIYLYSEALLFGAFDRDTVSIRGAIHGLAVPLLVVGARRQARSRGTLRVSQQAAFHTVTLLLVGGYLLFISGVGYYVRRFGGEWGSALQLGVLSAATIVLCVLLLSGAMRARLRVFLGKHFFAYRYDYRSEWLRFTQMLSAKASPQEMGVSVIRGLAGMVESPGGALWSRGLGDREFVQMARWNMARVAEVEPADSPFCRFLLDRGWIVDIDECAAYPQRYGSLALPAWLVALPERWLVVPLLVAEELVALVVLARPRTAVQVNWEVRDLLKTASRQAAGFLAQMHATEALLEARKFEAFNRMSAFVVHDLKNIVTQLSLMLKNAQRLQSNPEFQKDMLATVENSLEKMKQLMVQLRGGEAPAGGQSGVDLAAIVGRMEAVAAARGRAVVVEVVDKLVTRGHEERVERVLGHLVQNALDATTPADRVWVRLERDGGRAKVVVGDTGQGMSQEFVHTRLFKPFSSTKEGGMGIGAYESFQYLKELGGSVDVQSEPGAGTTVTILLPLLESRQKSDLDLVSAK